jgi:hypothetical protein
VSDTHQCPAGGCTRRVPAHMLMCREDWYRVPKALRNALWTAWDGGRGAGTPPHREAMRAAIDALGRAVTP